MSPPPNRIKFISDSRLRLMAQKHLIIREPIHYLRAVRPLTGRIPPINSVASILDNNDRGNVQYCHKYSPGSEHHRIPSTRPSLTEIRSAAYSGPLRTTSFFNAAASSSSFCFCALCSHQIVLMQDERGSHPTPMLKSYKDAPKNR